MKLSNTMAEILEYSAGMKDGAVYASRRTEDALIRRGLITYDAPDRPAHLPVITIAGWEWLKKNRGVDRSRVTDWGRMTLEEAWADVS